MNKVIHPIRSYNLGETLGEHIFVSFNVGPNGEIYLLLAANTLDYRTTDSGSGSFAKIVPDVPQQYRVLVIRNGENELDIAIRGEPFNIHTLQPLGNDLLLVCSRSAYRSAQDADLNARVYSRTGAFLRDFLLGDGIETIQVTRHGEIWTSYFDEGVFGNYGWNDPVGAAGLVAWNELGEKVYEYEAPGQVDPIVDCYALNCASARDVWCYYYTDFPLVHLHDKRIASTWKVPVSGSHAFAVANNYVLFAGGYDMRDKFQLVRLRPDGTSRLIGEFDLIGDDGRPVMATQTVGRGAELYVLEGTLIYTIDLNEVIATHGGG